MSHIAVEQEVPSMGVDNRKLGIWTFLGSEVMFFSGLIVTYLVMRGRSTVGPYPHQVLDVPLTAINTFVLICSSMTMVTALAAIQNGNARSTRNWLIATAALGLVFLGGQAFEFNKLANEGLSLSSNLFGATFFTTTGFHGTHVLIGVIWIASVLVRAFRGGVTPENNLSVEMVGLYWHFVDIIWIFLFPLLYLVDRHK